jgi:hypothetical protein
VGLIDHPAAIREASAGMIRALRDAAEPLPSPADAEAFGAFFDRFGDARVLLLLGEATPLGIEHPRGAPETYPFGL